MQEITSMLEELLKYELTGAPPNGCNFARGFPNAIRPLGRYSKQVYPQRTSYY